MASQAQIDANRRNSQKSCGPKTEAGKARAKLNALKHGSHAQTVKRVLPQENAVELDVRISKWINELNPRNDAERELVVETATPISADCSLSQAQNGTRPALVGVTADAPFQSRLGLGSQWHRAERIGVTGPHTIPMPQVACGRRTMVRAR
jgi:hypothetical protein